MDFGDDLNLLATRIPKQLDHLLTEAATSAALVMPFIQALGYNVFDPTEVVPEYTADVGIKKGEKVDYAVLRDGQPILLFEVKTWNADLDAVHASQLYRYFSVTPARIAVLTNGINYRFFTDLEEPNKMDERPFLEFSMLELKESVVDELKRFTKSKFEVENAVNAASELKYTNGIKKLLAKEYASPTADFVKLLARQVYSGLMTKNVVEQFTDYVRRAFQLLVTERINERLKSAIEKEDESEQPDVDTSSVEAEEPQSDVVTTADEIEAYNIVRAIMAKVVNPERVMMRDTKSYCGILLDDNNRKPICRLHFNTSNYYLGLFDQQKKEERVPLERLPDIYTHTDRLRAVIDYPYAK